MNSVIICEGETDVTLLQYYMQNKFDWKYADNKLKNDWVKSGKMSNLREYKKAKYLYRNDDKLVIISADSYSKIPNVLSSIDEINKIDVNVNFDKIVIVTDNDDKESEHNFFNILNEFLTQNKYIYNTNMLKNNEWLSINYSKNDYITSIGTTYEAELLPIVIPFAENGALETVLLNGIREIDDLHNEVIDFSCDTINVAHNKFSEKFLTGRSDCLKAKFDLAFIILTERDEYTRRKQYLQKNFKWEEFDSVNQAFSKLEQL